MQRLNELRNVLINIQDTYQKIIQKALPILEDLKDINESEYFEELNEDIVSIFEKRNLRIPSEKQILRVCQESSLDLLKDYESVKSELNIFINDLLNKGVDGISEKRCPFLASVWYGDMYDKHGILALKELQNDLKKQKKNINVSNILNRSLSKLTKGL